MSRAVLFFGMFCGVFLISAALIKGDNFNSDNERINSSFFSSNQESSLNKFFQESGATLPDNLLLIFSSIEESEPTDESGEEDAIEGHFPLHILSFNHNFLKCSFVSFSLSFQKRITIPFFLLHHSLKIPFA